MDRPAAARELAAARRRALGLHRAGRLDAAVAAYRAILARHPRACDCWCNLGAALRALGRRAQGLAALQQGLRVCPRHAGLNRNLGNALEDAGDRAAAREHHVQAVARCQAALRARPGDPGLHGALGWSLWKLKRLEAAAAAYARALAIEPAATALRLELGGVLTALGRYADNERQLRAAAPRNADVLAALGHSLVDQGRLEAGLACAAEALALDPGHDDARLARARANFLAGRHAAAWPDHVRRRSARLRRLPRTAAGRAWEGQDLAGQSILLYAEQGLGDAIQFARYAPLVARRGARVVLCCQPALVALLRRLPDVAEVVPRDRPWPRTDWVCSLMDLPAVWRTDLDSIPGACPYLPSGDPPGARLGPRRQFRIGIVWAGNPDHEHDRQRSCRPDDFAPLVELPGTELVSLQAGPRARELRASGCRWLIREADAALLPFEAAADALTEVDLVITVDTALAHLAGALGRPVWTLLAYAPDWRWMLGRDDTPWYPTMRLFRQRAPNDWAGVFQDVRRELTGLTAQHALISRRFGQGGDP